MVKLAIKGGPAEAAKLKEMVPTWPMIDDDDKKALIEVFESQRWCRLYSNSKTEQFENAFAKYQDAKHGIAVANGTVSLELILKTLGVGFGDEVIVPSVTFIATISAVTEVGAFPVFADADPETGSMSPESLEKAITERTKAVMVCHYAGYPVDFDKILPIVKNHNVFLIEDAAHAHGTQWKGRKVGAIGDMGSFSFQESKSLPAGEGGIVLTDNDELADRAALIHNIGRAIGKPSYEHYVLSSNYRMHEFEAALLLSKLKKYPQEVEIKHTTGEYLASELKKIGGVEPLRRDPRITKRGYYFFSIRYNPEEFNGLSRDAFLEALNAEGVSAWEGYGMPEYRQPALKRENLKGIIPLEKLPQDYENLYLPGAEEFCAREVCIPHEVLLAGKEGMDLIINSIRKIKEESTE